MKRKVRSLEYLKENFKLHNDEIETELGYFTSDMFKYCGAEIELDDYNMYDGWEFTEDVLEPLTPQIKEVSYDDLQDAEFSDGGVKWCKAKYIYTHVDGSYRSASGCWKHMRPIKKHNVEEFKQLARLT